jgi:hypothetical protein
MRRAQHTLTLSLLLYPLLPQLPSRLLPQQQQPPWRQQQLLLLRLLLRLLLLATRCDSSHPSSRDGGSWFPGCELRAF